MGSALPDTDEAYRRYRRLLLSTVTSMSRRGYSVSPADGIDFVHDFFAEAWPKLERSYQPSRGDFTPYLIAAFIRFARPRIVRSMHWSRSLVPLQEAVAAGDEWLSRTTPVEESVDVAFVRATLEQLSRNERELLRMRFAEDLTERDIARRLGTSRYAARGALASALGSLAVQLDERGALSSRRDWPLARALFAEHRTIIDAAARVGISIAQARRGRDRIMRALIGGIALNTGTQRRTAMGNALCELWRDLIAEPSNGAVAERARAVRDELLDHIENCESCMNTAGDRATERQLVEAVYGALGIEDEELSEVERQALDDLNSAYEEDETAVRVALADVLLPGPAGEDLRAHGLEGMEPLTLFSAMRAISSVVYRWGALQRPHGIKNRGEVVMTPAADLEIGSEIAIPRDVVTAEIAHVAKVSASTAAKLARWIVATARRYPRLLSGIDSSPAGYDAVRLTLTDRTGDENLLERWAPDDQAETRAAAQTHSN